MGRAVFQSNFIFTKSRLGLLSSHDWPNPVLKSHIVPEPVVLAYPGSATLKIQARPAEAGSAFQLDPLMITGTLKFKKHHNIGRPDSTYPLLPKMPKKILS